MNALPIQPGRPAYWHHRCTSPLIEGYDTQVLVLQVNPHTAKISFRRKNGTFKERWVKLSRLVAR